MNLKYGFCPWGGGGLIDWMTDWSYTVDHTVSTSLSSCLLNDVGLGPMAVRQWSPAEMVLKYLLTQSVTFSFFELFWFSYEDFLHEGSYVEMLDWLQRCLQFGRCYCPRALHVSFGGISPWQLGGCSPNKVWSCVEKKSLVGLLSWLEFLSSWPTESKV